MDIEALGKEWGLRSIMSHYSEYMLRKIGLSLPLPFFWASMSKREKRKMSKLLDIFDSGSCFVGGVCLADGNISSRLPSS